MGKLDQHEGDGSARPPSQEPEPLPGTGPSLWQVAASLAFLVVAFAGLAAWSWGKWTDPVIDFGLEAYLAWIVSEGGALYGDVGYRNGPLSPLWNGALFALFGSSIQTLVWANLAVLAAICGATFAIFRRALGLAPALAAAIVFLAVFAFSQYGNIANYNYVTPYQHSQTHGLLLSIVLIASLGRAAVRVPGRAHLPLAAAGLSLGAVLLTKVELALPALAVATAGFAVLLWLRPVPRGRELASFAAAIALPSVVCLLWLLSDLPPGAALYGMAGNWPHLTAIARDPFYARGAGLDHLGANALATVGAFAAVSGFWFLVTRIDGWLARRSSAPVALMLGIALFLALVAMGDAVAWNGALRALPLATIAIAGGLVLRMLREPRERERWLPLLLWSVLSLGLLTKMVLNARVTHYGFVLAMPATVLLAAVLMSPDLGPRQARPARPEQPVARAIATAVLAAMLLFFLRESAEVYRGKQLEIGPPGDSILVAGPSVSPRGASVQRALERLQTLADPESTLLVLPEGALFNYWLRMRNPSGYMLYLPPVLTAFGEQRMLDAIRQSPPDFIVLVHRLGFEFGVAPFGRDPRNGMQIMEWVNSHYQRIERIGAEPFEGPRFGIVILRRGDRSLGAAHAPGAF